MSTPTKNTMDVKIIAEIGINHNGSLDFAKQMILLAKVAGFDYVKFQKRNPDLAVPEHQKLKMRQTPWGEMTYIDYKHKIEFGKNEYDEIDRYCKELGIGWFASVWDLDSVDFMTNYTGIMKIPSALITNLELCSYAKKHSDLLLVSTGMSKEQEIEDMVKACNPKVIFHTNSTYPSKVEELNLQYITWLKNKYPMKEIGYSGHEYGLLTTVATVALGATWIERHITLDRNMWGSDQSSSIEPSGAIKLIKGIRDVEKAMQYLPQERIFFKSEEDKLKSLRG